MAYFISVDANGVIYGTFSAVSAAFVINNVKEGQMLVEVDRYVTHPENYIFDWGAMDIRQQPFTNTKPSVLAE